MKRFCWIGILVLLAMAACARPDTDPVETRRATSRIEQVPEPAVAERSRSIEGPSPELSAIDSLMWRQPDSALARLIPYFDTCCRDAMIASPDDATDTTGHIQQRQGRMQQKQRRMQCVSTAEYNRHYANLLLSELLYKNDYAQTNRSALLQAVTYFDSIMQVPKPVEGPSFKRNAFLDSRAHYINGVGYYENDSVVEACKEYVKALDVMEKRFKEKELGGHKAQFMALTYTRLTDLFSDLYLHEQAIYFAQMSLPYYQKQDAPSWYLARMNSEIGINYDIMDQLDSADYYYQNALMVLDDTNCLVYKDIVTLRSFLSYKKGAEQDSILPQLFRLLNLSDSEIEYLSRCLTIGEVYYHEKQYDSACHYLSNVYNHTNSIPSKKQAAEWLTNMYEIQGKESEMYEYAHFLAPFANQEENTSTTKSQLTELYNAFRQNILKQQHKQAMQKSMTKAIVVIGGLLVVILVITLLYHRNKKKFRLFESEKPNEKEIRSKAWDKYAAFMEEPVCQDIIQSVQGENIKRSATPKDYPNLVLNDEQLQQLAFTVNRYFGPVEYHLEQHGVNASPIMVSLCHLFLLGMDEKQAAILLDRDYSSISRYVKKLKTAFETQESLTVHFRNLVLSN